MFKKQSDTDDREPQGGIFNSFCCVPQRTINTNMTPFKKAAANKLDKLIIHIHGGGFVSMSSGSHQNYTRIWANDTKVPIFSIDYRLSPQY